MKNKLNTILNIYHNNDICMGELLSDIKVPKNTSYEEAFELYIKAMKIAEKDKFYAIKNDKIEKL